MKCINKPNKFLFIIIILFATKTYSQTITPFTFNMGGGYSNDKFLEWSIGESASIANFFTTEYKLNTGVLQPNTDIVTGIPEYGPLVFGNQIKIGPNPTTDFIHFKGTFNTSGSLKVQITNASSNVLIIHDAGNISNTYETNFSLDKYPSGIFYLKVFFKPNNGSAKTGVYKLIKL